jgi:cytochrome c
MRPLFIFATLLAFPTLFACGGGTPPAESAESAAATPAPAEEPAPANFAEQVARGQKLYGAQCAGCHGDAGEGKAGGGPPVVGLDKGALPLDPPPGAKGRTTQFKTVADIADFVVKTMPPKAPGSLSAEDYYAILAFDLKANGIDLGDKKLDGELAKTLEVPRK